MKQYAVASLAVWLLGLFAVRALAAGGEAAGCPQPQPCNCGCTCPEIVIPVPPPMPLLPTPMPPAFVQQQDSNLQGADIASLLRRGRIRGGRRTDAGVVIE